MGCSVESHKGDSHLLRCPPLRSERDPPSLRQRPSQGGLSSFEALLAETWFRRHADGTRTTRQRTMGSRTTVTSPVFRVLTNKLKNPNCWRTDSEIVAMQRSRERGPPRNAPAGSDAYAAMCDTDSRESSRRSARVLPSRRARLDQDEEPGLLAARIGARGRPSLA